MSVATSTASPRPRLSLRFSARDLLTTAIFAVLLIAVSYAIGMLGVISPLVWVLIIPLQGLAGGIPVTLFLTRVRHAGMFTLFATVIALFYLLGGNSALSTASIIGLGVLAEVILWVGRYRSRWAVIWAYTVFGLSFLTPLLPFVIDRKAYFASATWAEMGAEYIAAADALLTGPVLLGTGLAIAVAGFLGGLLGSAILRKHFVRAGLA